MLLYKVKVLFEMNDSDCAVLGCVWSYFLPINCNTNMINRVISFTFTDNELILFLCRLPSFV